MSLKTQLTGAVQLFLALRWFTVPLLVGAIVGGLLQKFWYPRPETKHLVLGLVFLAVLLAWFGWYFLVKAAQKRQDAAVAAQRAQSRGFDTLGHE